MLTRTALECLIKAGAFDSLGLQRAAMLGGVETALTAATRIRRDRSMGQVSLFGEAGAGDAAADGTEAWGEKDELDSGPDRCPR